jgi:hypothetical protein
MPARSDLIVVDPVQYHDMNAAVVYVFANLCCRPSCTQADMEAPFRDTSALLRGYPPSGSDSSSTLSDQVGRCRAWVPLIACWVEPVVMPWESATEHMLAS